MIVIAILETFDSAIFVQEDWDNEEKPIGKWVDTLKQSAENTLTPIPPTQKKPYISKETLDLMDTRAEAQKGGDNARANLLNKIIKNSCTLFLDFKNTFLDFKCMFLDFKSKTCF